MHFVLKWFIFAIKEESALIQYKFCFKVFYVYVKKEHKIIKKNWIESIKTTLYLILFNFFIKWFVIFRQGDFNLHLFNCLGHFSLYNGFIILLVNEYQWLFKILWKFFRYNIGRCIIIMRFCAIINSIIYKKFIIMR